MDCITKIDQLQTWCGKTPDEHAFHDTSHALLHIAFNGRYKICKNCMLALNQLIENYLKKN